MGCCRGRKTNDLLGDVIDELVGGAKAPRAAKAYASFFKQCAHFRDIRNKDFLIGANERPEEEVKDLLRHAALQFGPLGMAAATVNLYLSSIGYVHRLHQRYSPIGRNCKAKLPILGPRRKDGPPVRIPHFAR